MGSPDKSGLRVHILPRLLRKGSISYEAPLDMDLYPDKSGLPEINRKTVDF
jgi:hypothetical protein